MGFDWEDREFYASDYFEQIYQYAVILIKKGKAYVCEMTAEEISATRGTPQQAGKLSPCLLYTSDAADERSSVDLGGRRIIKKKKNENNRG